MGKPFVITKWQRFARYFNPPNLSGVPGFALKFGSALKFRILLLNSVPQFIFVILICSSRLLSWQIPIDYKKDSKHYEKDSSKERVLSYFYLTK